VKDLIYTKKGENYEEHHENDVKMGKYSKRILCGLFVILAVSIVLGGNFIKIIADESDEGIQVRNDGGQTKANICDYYGWLCN